MAIKKATIPWSAKALHKQVQAGKVTFDNVVQRGHCWDIERKSLLIHSMIEGYPIPPFYAAKSEAGYDMLDGKQRSEAICSFLMDDYVLKGLPEVTIEIELGMQAYDLNGKKFSQLPEDIRDAIKDYSLTVYYFDGITDDEINELFFRLNNGKPLSSIELTRVKAKSLATIREIGQHPIFSDFFTEGSLKKYTNESVVMNAYVNLFKSNPSFETKYIRQVFEEEDITEERKALMLSHLDYAVNLLFQLKEDKANNKLIKTLTSKTHLVTLLKVIEDAEKKGKRERLLEWAKAFFSNMDKQYVEASQAGAAKNENVDARNCIATASFDAFLEDNA